MSPITTPPISGPRQTPKLGDVPKPTGRAAIKISREEAEAFLKKRGLVGQKGIKWAKKRLRKKEYRKSLPRGREVTINDPEHAWPIVYGRVRDGGAFTFVHNKQESGDGTMNLRHVITLAGHEIDGVEKLFLDANEVEFTDSSFGWAIGGTKPDGSSIDYTDFVYLKADNTGTAGQAAYADLVADLPTFWTSAHRQRGLAHVYLRLKWKAQLFPDAQPDIWLQFRGKKVYDPRTATTAWSANAALCLADYLTVPKPLGPGFSQSDIYMGDTDADIGSLKWAAKICDEDVPLAAGGTENRYEAHGVFHSDEDREDIIAALEQAMGGYATYINGLWKFFPGTYITPTLTLTDDDLVGELQIQTMRSRSERFNAVKAQYVNAADGYKQAEMPPMIISAYVTEDGGETIFEDIGFEAVTSAGQAQRLAKIKIERVRRDQEIAGDFGLKALALEPGDTFMYNSARYGFSSKVFLVEETGLQVTSNMTLVCPMECRAIDEDVFDWDETQDEQEVNQAPATALPDPFTSTAPTGLALDSGTEELYVQGDGTIVSQIKVTWTKPADAFVTEGGEIEIQMKRSAGSVYRTVGKPDGDHEIFFINGVEDGVSYDVRIRSINALGIASSFVTETGHTVIGKTAPPSDVSVFNHILQNFRIYLSWGGIADKDLSHYEVRRGGANWAAATVIAEVHKGTTYIDDQLIAGTYTYRVKAIDSSGNESVNEATEVVLIEGPEAVTQLRAEVVDNNVLLRWTAAESNFLPVFGYQVFRGDTFIDATFIGEVFGTFSAIFELISGTFTYWVRAFDTARNVGDEASIEAIVNEPPDFVFNDIQNLAFDDTLTNCIEENGELIVCVTAGESFEDHFINNSWDSPQDQIDAGYPIYIQPAELTAQYIETLDFGAVISTAIIKLDVNLEQIDGETSYTPTLSISDDGVAWIDFPGLDTLLGNNFQYVKVTLDFENTDDTGIARITASVQVDIQEQRDDGAGTANAADVGGTTVNFNKAFADVESINVTPAYSASYPITAVYDFVDTPNPTSFKVLLYRTDTGARVSGGFSWTAKGI